MSLPCLVLLAFTSADGTARAATLLSREPAADARIVRLDQAPDRSERSWLVVGAIAPAGGKHVDIYWAERDSVPFRRIGRINDPAFAAGLCCGTLYQVPVRIGPLRAGTLLWAGSVGKSSERMSTRIYRSEDAGRNWSYLSDVVAARPGGVWEPEFTVARDGSLILFFSDETDPAQHSQAIDEIRSADGIHWRDQRYVVASKIQQDRPGMPVVRRLADGRWMMTYELVGPARGIVCYRLSDNGWDWGNSTDVGTAIRLPNGSFPANTPRFTVMPDGAILLAAHFVKTQALRLGERNGRVLFMNLLGNPALAWRTIPAPVPVPQAGRDGHDPCSNYSPSLLSSQNGAEVVEFASSWTDRGCLTSYAWAPWKP